MDPDWADLKERMNKITDSVLKEEMLLEVQRVKLKYWEKEQKVLVQNFREIEKSWKTDGSIENVKKIIRLRMVYSNLKRI